MYVVEQKKLTDWAAEPSLSDLKEEFRLAQATQATHMVKVDEWVRLLGAELKIKPMAGRSKVQPALIRKQAEWRYPTLTEPFLSADKLYKISPVTFEDAAAAKQNELLLNHQFRTQINRVNFIDQLIRGVVDEGTGIIRTGWSRRVKKVPETAAVYEYYPITTEEEQQLLQQALELKESDPRTFDETVPEEVKEAINYFAEKGQPVTAIKVGEQTVITDEIIENRPVCEVLNPRNVYVDPSCNGNTDKAMFIVVTRETCKADLLKDSYPYINLDKIDWTSKELTDVHHQSSTPNDFNFKDASRRKLVVYEYWGYFDITGDGTLTPILVIWLGEHIIYIGESPFSDGKLPFVFIPYLPIKRSHYGESDAHLLKDNQAIQGAVTRGIIDLLGRSANAQRGVAKGMLDTLNRKRYDSGQDYEFNPLTHPSNGIVEHKYPEIPNSALTVLGMQAQEAEALTGVKSFSSGISGASYGDVAAGVKGALDASAKREMAILRRVAKGLVDVGTRIISMNGDFLSDVEVVRVTNEEFVPIARDELKGNFDLVIDIATAEVDNMKVQDLAFMLQTLGNNIDQAITMKILVQIAELKRMPELAKQIKDFKPEPDPLAEKLKQIEVAKAELELQELQSQIELNKAKARDLLANADKTDLDYVEQETGTKHARDLDRQAAQARANQDLQVTKALTTPKKLDTQDGDIEAAIGFNRLSKEDKI